MLTIEEQVIVSKGVANHYRIKVLDLLMSQPNLSLDEIVSKLKGNYKTIGLHTRKLHRAKLIDKKYRANFVLHTITPRGSAILKFLRKLE